MLMYWLVALPHYSSGIYATTIIGWKVGWSLAVMNQTDLLETQGLSNLIAYEKDDIIYGNCLSANAAIRREGVPTSAPCTTLPVDQLPKLVLQCCLGSRKLTLMR